MNGRGMLGDWLWCNGYTALVCHEADACGCGLDDLAPCDESPLLCHPAYAVRCDGSLCDEDYGCEANASEDNPQVCYVSAALFEEATDD